MSDLPLDQVRTLLAAVDEGTFDAAAQALQVTPSAISQRIKALEQRIGRVLLLRSKPIQLTDSGEVIVRFARQLARLERDASTELGLPDTGEPTRLPIAVGSDALGTWLMPAFTGIGGQPPICFELIREDEGHTTQLLHQGLVMAAVSSTARPVKGCLVRSLGRMRYHAMASPDFHARWLATGRLRELITTAPVVVFDRKDDLQDSFLRTISAEPAPGQVRHYVPGTDAFRQAVLGGLGWGIIPEAQAQAGRADGRLVDLAPTIPVDVPLYWHQWKLDSPALAAVAESVARVAAKTLHN